LTVVPSTQDSDPDASARSEERPLAHALAAPQLYPGRPHVEVRETHASWVFLAGRYAYKVKKPVRLAFLDYSTLAARRAACREEVRVNHALAPSIYLGVRAIVRGGDGELHYAEQDAPGAVEYAVQMRRFDEQRTLQGAIDAHTLTRADIRAAAVRLADFHRGARPVSVAEPAALLAAWRTNLEELEALAHPRAWALPAMHAFATAFTTAHAEELARRAHAGYVRDCHGDLRCEHVLLERSVRFVDRIEFDPTLRHMDVARDLAFLATDLESHGAQQAASTLVNAYRDAGGRAGSEQLRAFYGTYWALVRAKVALITAGERSGAPRRRERDRATRLWQLAERLCWRARRPLALVVCGAPASGKSTLAAALARVSELPVVSSDVLRKHRAGLAPTERAGPEHYTRAASRAVYELLSHEALAQLELAQGVIVDASCYSRRERAVLFQRLQLTPARLLVVRCRVTRETALARTAARAHDPQRISDATAAIATTRARRFQELDELPPTSVLALDAERALSAQVASVAGAADELMRVSVPRAPRGPAPCFSTADPGVYPVAAGAPRDLA